MSDDRDVVTILVCEGVEGPSVYINDCRVAGPKPWGGATAMREFKATSESMKRAGFVTNRELEALHTDTINAVREAAKAVTGGNCTFADDDVAVLRTLAQRAVDAGITDGVPMSRERPEWPARQALAGKGE